jgi:hypothetical protein
MGNKEDLHKLKFSEYVAPIAMANTAAFDAISCMDTAGYESNMFVIYTGELGSTDAVVKVYESNTAGTQSASSATQCAPEDIIFAVGDNDTTALAEYVKVATTSGTLTLANTDDSRVFCFAYIGRKRYIRIHVTSTVSGIISVLGVQGHFRYQGRAGLHTA